MSYSHIIMDTDNSHMQHFPILSLNHEIPKVLQKIVSLDIYQGIKDGLNPRITLVDESNGPLSTIAEISEYVLNTSNKYTRYVKLSAAYCQILWLIGYLTLWKHDKQSAMDTISQMSEKEKKEFLYELSLPSPITSYLKYI